MDKDLFYISMFLLFIGIGGQMVWYFFGVVPKTVASFQELQNVTGYAMMLGFILLPAGLFKDGLPSPGYTAKVFIGVVLVLLVGVAFTGVLLMPGATTTGPKANGFISIAQGSSTPNTVQTFTPGNVVVIIGMNNTVQWTNNDNAPHTVTSRPGDPGTPFNSGIIGPGGTYVHTFDQPGVYNYYCTLHDWMHGTITVKSSA